MLALYNLLLLLLLPLLLLKSLTNRKYRTGLKERFGFLPRTILKAACDDRPIWFHAASVGEVLASVRLIESIKKKWPEKKLLVSTFTPTGNETAREKLSVDGVIYFPIDIPFIVRSILKKIRPEIIILMETELWPNFINHSGFMGIPVIVVNGRISERSYRRYQHLRPLLKRMFPRITLLIMQSEEDAARITSLGAAPEKVEIAGNIKYDFPAEERKLSFLEKWDGKVLAAGSTHQGEDAIILDIFIGLKSKYPDLKLVLAPRHPERTHEIEKLLKERDLTYDKRSEITDHIKSSLLLVDTLGELSSLYRYSDAVFVGGSLVPVGGHNVFEPALYGKPIIFGPHMENFLEISHILVECGGGLQVKNAEELKNNIDRLLSDSGLGYDMGKKAKAAVLKNQGATEKTVEAIAGIIR